MHRNRGQVDVIETQLFRAKKPQSPVVFRHLVRGRGSLPLLMSASELSEWTALADVPAGQLSPRQRARAEELGARRRKLTPQQSHALFLEGKADRLIGVEVLGSGQTMFIDWYHSDDERFFCACDTALDNGDGKIATLKEWRARLAAAQCEGVQIPFTKSNPVRKAHSRRSA